ncbi:hypothetical protein GCM10010430_70830 [Kitasatospora cystarginea]|uniref:Restriction endonuclease type IV Mrr domain-containing protein n=1 Tax=Kitasatospora cystarginea TaxID=58350 RepID=A0ABP5RVX2_9ACTN
MIAKSTLQGYLLEEALSWLLRNSGYSLLTEVRHDPEELTIGYGGALCVRGRSARHQVDVLGEFAFTPAFSLPVRMFLEAKFKNRPCDLAVVRNAHGVLHDVNQNFAVGGMSNPGEGAGAGRPRRRYQYVYALFSTSGFTSDAQRYAIAHQISLVDLSGPSFARLLTVIERTADELLALATKHVLDKLPLTDVRARLRYELGTASVPPDKDFALPVRDALIDVIMRFTTALTAHTSTELLLGFPAAPFILPLATSDAGAFLQHAESHPAHHVRIQRRGHHTDAEWTVTPLDNTGAYELAFKLPPHVEQWISEIEESERARAVKIKRDFFSAITIYRDRPAGGATTYQLLYDRAAMANGPA